MSGPQPPTTGPGPALIQVFVTTAVRTSAGSVPGPKRLPADEAARLVAAKHALYGSEPPRGWS